MPTDRHSQIRGILAWPASLALRSAATHAPLLIATVVCLLQLFLTSSKCSATGQSADPQQAHSMQKTKNMRQ